MKKYPEDGKRVIVCVPEVGNGVNSVVFGRWLREERVWRIEGSPSDWDVKWWMEIPTEEPEERFSVKEICDWLEGWKVLDGKSPLFCDVTIENLIALAKCDQDGIGPCLERERKQNQ